jgi:hypothetical protein
MQLTLQLTATKNKTQSMKNTNLHNVTIVFALQSKNHKEKEKRWNVLMQQTFV